MPKNAPKEQWRTVRRYVLAGERERAQRLLEKIAQEYPRDAEEAREELRRLTCGQQLRCTETQKERKERLCAEALHRMAHDVGAHDAHRLASLPTEELQRLRQTLREGLRTLSESKTPAPPGTNAYKKALEYELRRRRKRSTRTLLLGLALVGVALLAAGGTAWALHSKAAGLAAQLETAWRAKDWERTVGLLKAADTGINRLMHRPMGELINGVINWQNGCTARAKELRNQMEVYRRREAISTLSLEERADFLRHIRALPMYHAKGLLASWEELCRPEKEKLDMQRDAILAEVQAAVTAPTLSGRVAEDAAALRRKRHELERIINHFADAREAFDLPTEVISPGQELMTQVEAHLADIEALNRAEMLLRNAHTYAQHYEALHALAAKQYPPALEAAKAGRELPTEESVCKEMRAYRYKIPREMPPEVVRAIVEKGPTFCASYPAGLEQLHLMEDIFTSRTLRQKVHEVFRANGEVHYTDEPPTVTEKGGVRFTLSELDPARQVAKDPRMEWENARAVWTRTLDATPVLRATGISRESFFLKANLPDLLARITAIHDKECPALAKAYVFHTVMEVMKLHNKKPDILGLRYSPTLQADLKSFRLVGTRCKMPLSASCWLSRTNETLEAEAIYGQWFDAHADRRYPEEMSRNLARILRTRARYVGYVDAQGQPRYREPLADGTTLWYIADGKLVTSACGQPMRAPEAYSPIFVES